MSESAGVLSQAEEKNTTHALPVVVAVVFRGSLGGLRESPAEAALDAEMALCHSVVEG